MEARESSLQDREMREPKKWSMGEALIVYHVLREQGLVAEQSLRTLSVALWAG